MAEALVAIGLAANIAQFVGYGITIISETREVYHSARGAKEENLELHVVVSDIKDFNERICGNASNSLGKTASTDEVALRKLAEQCQPLVDRLLSLLKTLEAREGRRFPKLEAFRKALRSAAKRQEIEDLERRLRNIEGQVSLRLLNLFRNDQSEILKALQTLNETARRIESTSENHITNLTTEIDRFTTSQSLDLSATVSAVMKQNEKLAWEQEILNGLSFPVIQKRYDDIKDAHKKTLRWIYDNHETKYQVWLECEAGIYWVTGKPGSGKSTLMKRLYGQDSTKKGLKTWAGSKSIVTASYYFWNAGSSLQKSQEGLLRSLLYQIFQAHPAFIMRYCTQAHHRVQWTIKELQSTLEKVLKDGALDFNFCFFLDGLDEYEGDATDIIEYVQRLAAFSNLKLCVSSRSWNEFQIAFKDYPKLQLETLTKNDMQAYVQDSLNGNPIFQKLAEGDSRCEELISDIARKAEGVWLWVYLVVRDLLRDIKRGEDSYDDLQRRLDAFPSELNDYFQRILDNLDPLYREETTRIFLVLLESWGDLPLHALEGLELDTKSPGHGMRQDIHPMSHSDFLKVAQKWQKRLSNRCKDLLAVSVPNEQDEHQYRFHVDFLHKTIRDFLRDNYFAELRLRVTPTFEPRICLCHISLYSLKVLPEMEISQFMETARVDIHLTMISSHQLTNEGAFVVGLLDELDQALSVRASSGTDHWTVVFSKSSGGVDVAQILALESKDSAFLAFAAFFGLDTYISNKLEMVPGSTLDSLRVPLLGHYFWHMVAYGFLLVRSRVSTVDILLQRGEDPNEKVEAWGGCTVWEFLLVTYVVHDFGSSPNNLGDIYVIEEIMTSMLTYGANLDVKLELAKEFFKSQFGKQQSKYSLRIKLKRLNEPIPTNLSEMLSASFPPDVAQRLQAKVDEITIRKAAAKTNSSLQESPTLFAQVSQALIRTSLQVVQLGGRLSGLSMGE